jgi:hypothetical protein
MVFICFIYRIRYQFIRDYSTQLSYRELPAEPISYFEAETKVVFSGAMLAQSQSYQFLENRRKPQFYKYFREPDSKDKGPLTFEVFKSVKDKR